MKRLACALVLAGSGCLLAASGTARAAPLQQAGGLQLSILTQDPNTISDRMSVDVSYRGGAVDTVELYLDGVLAAKRQIGASQSRGVITFTLDTLQLTEGDHKVQVKAFGLDNKPVVVNGKVRIPSLDANALLRIAYPPNGIQVNGVIPIRVSLDSDLQNQKPYVTFFVDKELKVLRNFAPYEYNWDTTSVINGWHVLEAWSQSADQASPLKARAIRVNVNNATGETRKLNTVEDLRTETKAPVKTAKKIVIPIEKVTPPVKKNVVPAPSVDPGTALVGAPANDPRLYGGFTANAASPVVRPVGPAARMMGGAVLEPKGRMGLVSSAKSALPGLSEADKLYAVIPPSRVGNSGILPVRPGSSLRRIARQTGVSVDELARLNNMPRNARIHGTSVIVPQAGLFDVAFDGTRIAFDVQPRIESGVKLAPFRQIFEHTGGRLYWFNEAKTVRAVNATREIEIKVGNASALVNNDTITMEHKPFIDGGRTIVPLSFIRDSMSVKINFDAKTGRLLIESNK